MKSQDLLDAIGEIDESLVPSQDKRRGRRTWAAVGALAACLALFLCLPLLVNLFGEPDRNFSGDQGQENRGFVQIYYVDGAEIAQEEQLLPLTDQAVFFAWRSRSGLGSEVELLGARREGDVYTLTVSEGLAAYLDGARREPLLRALAQTMIGFSGAPSFQLIVDGKGVQEWANS